MPATPPAARLTPKIKAVCPALHRILPSLASSRPVIRLNTNKKPVIAKIGYAIVLESSRFCCIVRMSFH